MAVVGNINPEFIPKYTYLKAAQVPFLLPLSKFHPNSQLMYLNEHTKLWNIRTAAAIYFSSYLGNILKNI